MRKILNKAFSPPTIAPGDAGVWLTTTLQSLERVVAILREPFLILDKDLRIRTANQAFYQSFGLTPEETENQLVYRLGKGRWDIPALRTLLEDTLSMRNCVEGFEIEHDFSNLGRRRICLNARRLQDEDGVNELILLAIEDISEHQRIKPEEPALSAREPQHKTTDAEFRSLFESVPGLYLVLSPDDYRIVAASDAYLKATMVERSTILNRLLFEVFPGDPNQPETEMAKRNVMASLERVKQNRITDIMAIHRYPIRRPEAQGGGFEERYWSTINSPVFGPDGGLNYIIHRAEDVTSIAHIIKGNSRLEGENDLPQKNECMTTDILLRAQEIQKLNAQLGESEQRYRQLIQSLPAAIYTCDAEGRVTLYNAAAAALWGREPEIGKDLWCGSWRIYRPDGSPLALEDCPMAIAIREGRSVRNERIVIERPDGIRVSVLPHPTPLFDTTGAITGAINLLMDVTEQNRAHVVQARLAAIVESSDDAIVSKDLQGVVQSWNKGAERIFGYSAVEMIGQPITRIIPAHLQDEETHILGKLCRGERIDHYETVRVAKDGRSIYASISVAPVRDASGRIIGASKVARDITEQKRAANALLEADRRKNEFLAMLAHELRNPLDAISNAVHLLQMTDKQAPQNRGLEIISRQTGQLTRLIDELLDVSRITQGKIHLQKERLEASVVISRAAETVQPLMQARKHELRVYSPKETLWLTGDPARLEQIFVNLLTNAAKYTDAGGCITITARREGGTLAVAVRDNGIGMSEDAISQVFEPFTQNAPTLDRKDSGLGIGLTLVKVLAEMHGGSIEARSEGPGQGSEFTLRLPLMEDIPARPDTTTIQAGMAPGPSRRVLVVDDNRDSAESLGLLLEIMNHKVQIIHDGPSAVEATRAFRPDVVLLDIGLPGLNGYEVARRVRREPELKQTLLVAVSGYCQEEDRKRSREAGFDHHLAKPVDHQTLAALLTEKL